MVFLHLPWELLKHFSSQLHAVVVVLRELNELHEVTLGLVALEVGHLAVIVIKLMHCAPILTTTDSDNDDAEW